METLNLILVDDHEVVRDGLKALLFGKKHLKVIGEAYDSEEFFELLEKQIPDIAVLDIELPTLSGIDIALKLEEMHPEIKKIVLSANVNEKTVAEAINAGVLGILPKTCKRDELLSAIEKVQGGEQFYTDYVTDIILKSYVNSNHLPEKYEKKKEIELSDREIEVIKCFAEGMIYKEIADELNISPRTVESHKINILKKLHLNSIIDLVKFAIKNNIVVL